MVSWFVLAASAVLAVTPAGGGATDPDTQDQQQAAAKPVFQDGDTAWFATPIEKSTKTALPSECIARFGEGTSTDLDSRSNILCYRTVATKVGPEVVEAFFETLIADRRNPPSKQKTVTSLWADVLPGHLDMTCPKGMGPAEYGQDGRAALQVKPPCDPSSSGNIDRAKQLCLQNPPKATATCTAHLTLKEFCPQGRVDLAGRRCLVRSCAPGLRLLAEASGLDMEGCFKCARGELDLKETAGQYKVTPEAFASYTRSGWNYKTVLCRVGPPRLAEKKTKSRR